MSISIRSLTEDDLIAADEILGSAFQRSGSWINDLRLFQQLQPGGTYLACQHKTPAGIVASVVYPNCAYIGMMGVHQAFQRQGVGSALMRHLLARLDRQSISQVMLDASRFGQPLYKKLGFTALDIVYVLQRKNGNLNYRGSTRYITQLSHQDLERVTVIDKQAFGFDRSTLLQALAQNYSHRAFLLTNEQGVIDGYLVVQEKRIGPWVMKNREGAELLLRAALSLPIQEPATVVVPGENMEAITLLQNYGFEIVRVNRHMVRGSIAGIGDRSKIYGQTSLSLG